MSQSNFELWLRNKRDCSTNVISTTLKCSFDVTKLSNFSFFDPKTMIHGKYLTQLYREILLSFANEIQSKLIYVQKPGYDVLWHIPIQLGFRVEYFSNIREIVFNKNVLAIVIANPHNPSGLLSSNEELLFLCKKYGIKLIIDEIFSPIPFKSLMNESHESINENQIILSSLWKCFGIPNCAYAQGINLPKINSCTYEFEKNMSLVPQVKLEQFDFLINNKKYLSKYLKTDLVSDRWFCNVDKSVFSSNGVPTDLFGYDNNKYRISWCNRNLIQEIESLKAIQNDM